MRKRYREYLVFDHPADRRKRLEFSASTRDQRSNQLPAVLVGCGALLLTLVVAVSGVAWIVRQPWAPCGVVDWQVIASRTCSNGKHAAVDAVLVSKLAQLYGVTTENNRIRETLNAAIVLDERLNHQSLELARTLVESLGLDPDSMNTTLREFQESHRDREVIVQDLGYVPQGELPPSIATALEKVDAGASTGLIPVSSGVVVLLVDEKIQDDSGTAFVFRLRVLRVPATGLEEVLAERRLTTRVWWFAQ